MRKRLLILILIAGMTFASCRSNDFNDKEKNTGQITVQDVIKDSIEEKTPKFTLPKDERIELESTPFIAKEGETYTFISEKVTPISYVRYNRDYWIFDAATQKKHRLELPWCDSVIAYDGQKIIYSGLNSFGHYSLMSGDIKSKRVNTLVYHKEYREPVFTLYKDGWLYGVELEWYREVPKLFKINIETGEKVLFEKSLTVSTKYLDGKLDPGKLYDEYIMDERGMVPKRGRNGFYPWDDVEGYFNTVMESFSLGDKGVLGFSFFQSWNEDIAIDLREENADYYSAVVGDEDKIYFICLGDGNKFYIKIYDYSGEMLEVKEIKLKKWIGKFAYVNKYEDYIVITSRAITWDEGDYSGVAMNTKTGEVEEFLDGELSDFIREQKLKGIPRLKEYENEEKTHLDSVPEVLRNDRGNYIEKNASIIRENSRYTFYFGDNRETKNRELLLYDSEKKEAIKIHEEPYLWDYRNSGESILYTDKETYEEKTISIVSNKDNVRENNLSIGMNMKQAMYILRKNRVNYWKGGTVPQSCNAGLSNWIMRDALKSYDFGDIVVHMEDKNGERRANLQFDEKTQELVFVEINDHTLLGIEGINSLDELVKIYGDDYKVIEEQSEEGEIEKYQYEFGKTFFSIILKKETQEVKSIQLSKFGEGYKREDHNQKYWLVLYDQYVDLTVKLDERFLMMLGRDQKIKLLNSYYAKHGYVVEDNELREYYKLHYWYNEKYTDKKDAEELMSSTDKANIDLIRKHLGKE